MKTFADSIIQFNKQLNFSGKLPDGILMMNPFRENEEVLDITEIFYKKLYNDNRKRKIILGINPGRFGGGATGIPFTDTKRLSQICKINANSINTHEPSSVFVYEVIANYGGVKKFYKDYYINSICPLGFIKQNKKGNWVNCNFYDQPDLFFAVQKFIASSLKKQIGFGIDTEVCLVLGKKNTRFLEQINENEKLFKSIVTLEHPRYIQQYKQKQKEKYVSDYLKVLKINS